MIFHIDIDAFFTNVEEKYYPEFANQPFAIGGYSKGGVIGTCNYLARQFGVKKGMSINEAFSKCPKLIISNNHRERYEYWSKKFFNYLMENFTSNVEMASIDECYLWVDDIVSQYHDNYLLLASIMQKNILDNLGLSVSIGISQTKEIAKIATSFKKPHGITYISNDEIEKYIFDLPIEKIIGIGKKTFNLLKRNNIYQVRDFIKPENEMLLTEIYGINYSKIKNGILGKGNLNIQLNNNFNKSIEKSFRFDYIESDEEVIKSKLKLIGEEVYDEMLENHQRAGMIIVYLKYKDHVVYKKTKNISLTDNIQSLLKNWFNLFFKLWDNSKPVILVGVGVGRLI